MDPDQDAGLEFSASADKEDFGPATATLGVHHRAEVHQAACEELARGRDLAPQRLGELEEDDLVRREVENGLEVLSSQELAEELARTEEAAGLDLDVGHLAGHGREDHGAGEIQLGPLQTQLRGLGLVLGVLQLLGLEQRVLIELLDPVEEALRPQVRQPVFLRGHRLPAQAFDHLQQGAGIAGAGPPTRPCG